MSTLTSFVASSLAVSMDAAEDIWTTSSMRSRERQDNIKLMRGRAQILSAQQSLRAEKHIMNCSNRSPQMSWKAGKE